jgi:2-polyprenyl-6-methoxyphenol hydroxylase-like FAD-dependent oxidoreductase
MYPKTVLVSGAGIAGTTHAYWLIRHGFEPILIERAPAFRSGGYMIDFWGVGYEVANRMGLLPRLQATGYFIREFRLVGREGRWIGGFAQDSIRSLVGDRFSAF